MDKVNPPSPTYNITLLFLDGFRHDTYFHAMKAYVFISIILSLRPSTKRAIIREDRGYNNSGQDKDTHS